ncbi:unnamed protein product [Porites evermanni]|uniref:Uncharacterized protein n=1 Tax=Porites evermanni TaxID=104178 RepID=A0ABN8M972_9CNID|nr:unnamed protein product [Porites evermanni]
MYPVGFLEKNEKIQKSNLNRDKPFGPTVYTALANSACRRQNIYLRLAIVSALTDDDDDGDDDDDDEDEDDDNNRPAMKKSAERTLKRLNAFTRRPLFAISDNATV